MFGDQPAHQGSRGNVKARVIANLPFLHDLNEDGLAQGLLGMYRQAANLAQFQGAALFDIDIHTAWAAHIDT